MARETFAESVIPAEGKDDVPYADHRAIARGLMGRVCEAIIGTVLGAGGAGGSLLLVPFEPAVIEIINAAGATPAFTKYVMLGTPEGVQIILGALDATAEAPAVTQVGANDWTILLNTADAPDGETVLVTVYGVRDVTPGL